ncbi:MAG: 4-hydroxy-tetrahydrodipicolinate synthase [Pseudoalteromonas rhizosphaerae]|jgi:4-hydroxy-tetrahydrodipicolinate synthase|uniref:4-hydroxy-tetrahydrodipicolinate synthase n=1 Tax=Pseudoalteromonas neustonica TaxID=1840331 RepID=A0ABY3FD79_9GAMM|nr:MULTISPECIES: 4-hydroxy-tetrahydrodipicolinate synthase [Pseudoalteromonas]MBB1292867.1 4-hydroxy-tetrahydrodipicolinate synthase [Pseudoalteromonas sp. SR41-4]MBB1303233.1 4-hydroxy-tetrahydrodipicolinate synthase [Pseudoalteromonas sp. SR44-8]MBB1310267.1 4-hydroxy-tetrahydrodipicolinate synthase [Pseudoalteromonas sp. SR41-8]MBB1399548.1 4-hydroxy-tetrahydrodipicolinate synthase [Pseudoalteromonas sp. SG44-8]MBB1409957.1 4-hydroxy-tetrahydrodipicolinate synthase [Pseudoalteromonas sp. SG|tara:strand:+ start:973 stop:1857 length:885 start_codon:yes stop_codon:yes gene_type:complete
MINNFNLNDYPLWTALVTPFTDAGEVDYATLDQLVAQQQVANNGILLLGSTGEGLALTLKEQQAIVEHVCQLTPTVPLMVAVGGINLKQQIAWVEYCNQLPIHSYLLGTPLYAKPGVVGQTHWFESLLNTSKHPCMLYNVPGRSAVDIPSAVISNLKDHKNLWALKEASGDIAKFEGFRKVAPNLAIFSGDDALMPYFAQAGAKGLVSVAANAWPVQTHEFVKRSLSGQHPNLFADWSQAIQSLFAVANPIPVKVLMHLQGRINSPYLRPPLTHLELTQTDCINNANNTILSWH